jgi:hypothetical protein
VASPEVGGEPARGELDGLLQVVVEELEVGLRDLDDVEAGDRTERLPG